LTRPALKPLKGNGQRAENEFYFATQTGLAASSYQPSAISGNGGEVFDRFRATS